MTQAQTPAQQRRPRKQAVRLGKEMYQRDILPPVEGHHFGEYVVIDNTRVVVEHLRAQRPDAVEFLCQRVGYRALRSTMTS